MLVRSRMADKIVIEQYLNCKQDRQRFKDAYGSYK